MVLSQCYFAEHLSGLWLLLMPLTADKTLKRCLGHPAAVAGDCCSTRSFEVHACVLPVVLCHDELNEEDRGLRTKAKQVQQADFDGDCFDFT